MRVLSLILLVFLFSCKKECFQKAGPIEVIKRDLADFKSLNIEGPIRIELIETPEAFALIEATNSLHEAIYFEENGEELRIRLAQGCGILNNPEKNPQVSISLPALKHLYFGGTASLYNNDTLKRDSFKIECWNSAGDINLKLQVNTLICANHIGPSDIHLSGSADLCYVYSGDIGFMDFRNLNANGVYLNHEGLGDVFLQATHTLEAEMKSHGRLYYSGTPRYLTITGSSAHKVFKLEP